jgi:hypothetical protein
MIEFDPAARVTVFNYAGRPVDIVNRDDLKPYIRPTAMADTI